MYETFITVACVCMESEQRDFIKIFSGAIAMYNIFYMHAEY